MQLPSISSKHAHESAPQRLVVGFSGASGAIPGIRLLEVLQSSPTVTHLVLSESAPRIIQQETSRSVEDLLGMANLAHYVHSVGASIASSSYDTQCMVIIPCSIKTLSAVANSYSDDLLSRAADVTLKEGRPLILVVRETPDHPDHLCRRQ